MGLRVDERIVAGGGDGDDLVVHHLVLRGSNRSIGRHLGELVRARYGVPELPVADPAPCPRERLRASAAFVPPSTAGAGHPLVSRTSESAGPVGRLRPGEPPSAGQPYVIELHPDEGYPSIAVCAYDLQGAALDGVNAEGLVAVAIGDLGAAARPPGGPGALQVVRWLLDRCASAAEARRAILAGDVEPSGPPARWLVADRHGLAFLLEVSADGALRWTDAGGRPLEVASASADGPLRTLWHGEYDAVERRLSARFFVGAGDWQRGEAPELVFRLA